MRLVVALMCLGLLSAPAVARAQTAPVVAPPAPSTYTPPEPAPAPTYAPAPSQGPSESPEDRAARYSRFSSGEGGLMLIFTEVLAGAVTGGLYGHSLDTPNGTYLGGVVGGLLLGTAAAVYQYYVPVERNESLLVAGGATLGFLAGYGFGAEAELSGRGTSVAALVATQLGIAGVLAATAAYGDISDGDTTLVGMSALYAFVLTGLVESTMALSSGGERRINLTPALIAPLLGMGVGGLLAVPFELAPSRVFKLTAIPLGVGAVLLVLGSALADGPAIPLSAMGGIAASFVITLLATADETTEYPPSYRHPRGTSQLRSSSGIKAMPVPVLMRTGGRNESMTAGPGMLMRF